MAEISRVLKPGGIFVASTILTASSALGELIGDNNASIFRGVCSHSWQNLPVAQGQIWGSCKCGPSLECVLRRSAEDV